jgi:hypothetical protein
MEESSFDDGGANGCDQLFVAGGDVGDAAMDGPAMLVVGLAEDGGIAAGECIGGGEDGLVGGLQKQPRPRGTLQKHKRINKTPKHRTLLRINGSTRE